MVFRYPIQSKTMKDIDRVIYRTFNAIGINMNKYNHDSSNTFHLINTASKELERVKFDINYQFNPSMSNIDFVTIDRINRFYINKIDLLKKDQLSGIIYSEAPITGFSSYTNKTYSLENINRLTDFSRHSLPIDSFVEKQIANFSINDVLPQTIILSPNVSYTFSPKKKISNTKITIALENFDIKSMLIFPAPILRIRGYSSNNEKIEEYIKIDSSIDLISKYEYSKIEDLLLTGVTEQITISLYPSLKFASAELFYNYVDREEQYVYRSVFTIDKSNVKLLVNRVDDTFTFPPNLDRIEEFNLDIDDGYEVLDYYMDSSNLLAYTIIYNNVNDKKLAVYPLIVPDNNDNLAETKNTEQQNVKISYIRDTISKKYIFTVYPASIVHGIDSVDISIKHFHKREMGVWSSNTQYLSGDLILYAGEMFVVVEDHLSSEYFDLDKVILQKEYITQDLILDLVLHGIENNKIEISFDRLFKISESSIVQIDSSGHDTCSTQILTKYNKIKPLYKKDFSELFSFINTPLSGAINPVIAQENTLLNNKINNYNVGPITLNISGVEFTVYSLTSTNKIYINGFPLVNVFNSFFLDGTTGTIITSDTITQVIG